MHSSALPVLLLTLLSATARATIVTGILVRVNNTGVDNVAWLKGVEPCVELAVLGPTSQDPCQNAFGVSSYNNLKLKNCGADPMKLTAPGYEVDCKPASGYTVTCETQGKQGQITKTFEC